MRDLVGGCILLAGLTMAAPVLADPLAGRWRVDQIDGAEPVTGSRLLMEFRNGRLAGFSSCNRFGAPYTINGDSISFGRAMLTRMACPPPLMAQERRFLDILAGANGWAKMKDGLTIRTSDGGGFHAVPVKK